MSVKATVNTDDALEAVKQVQAYVNDIAESASKFQSEVMSVYEATNMPIVNQIHQTALKLSDNMKVTKESMETVLTIMEKYKEEVDEISEGSDGFEGL
jgi:ABC-type transporter Mla subunit MlaD